MRTSGAFRLIAMTVLVALATGCARGSSLDETTALVPLDSTTTDLPPPPAGEDPSSTGVAAVTIDSVTYDFVAIRCVVAFDVFIVDGANDDGASLQIRHASPPTREPAEPSMAVFVLEANDRWEAPPAAITFRAYDPETGRALGSAPVNLNEPTGAEATAEFEVTCSLPAAG